MNRELHFSTGNDEWATPLELFNQLNREFQFTLDPCATKENAKVERYFTREQNGLMRSWAEQIVFMNPPYSQIPRWMAKAYSAARDDHAVVVCLVPSRTDTRWWHKYALRGQIRFIRGRIRFNNHSSGAPFPSSIVIFRSKFESFPKFDSDQRPRTQEWLFE